MKFLVLQQYIIAFIFSLFLGVIGVLMADFADDNLEEVLFTCSTDNLQVIVDVLSCLSGSNKKDNKQSCYVEITADGIRLNDILFEVYVQDGV